MNKLFGSWFLLGLAATLQAQPPKLESKIQVFVYNSAQVSTETLAQAEREAARIYKHIGIEMEWLDCSLTPDGAQAPACELPDSPARLVLRLFPGRMGQRTGVPQESFGYALYPPDGGFAMTAQVCAQCCAEMAKKSEATPAVILGHVIAHELGHLLLGAGSHGPAGLMHVPWEKKEMQSVARGALLFTSREADKMRRQIAERLRGEAPVQTASR